MRVLFLCEGSLDISNWSGTTLSLYQIIKKYAEVHVVEFKLPFILRVENKFRRKIGGIEGDLLRYPRIMNWRKRLIENALRKENYDCIFSVGSVSAAAIPDAVNIPVYFYTDATFRIMNGYYGNFSAWDKKSKYYAELYEQKAADIVSTSGGKAFVSSEWAAKSMINDYHVPAGQVEVLKIGPNGLATLSETEIKEIIQKKVNSISAQIRLLFVGVDFERKGGKDFLQLCQIMHREGISYHADIVGCNPAIPDEIRNDITVHGFLSKKDAKNKEKIVNLYKNAHFFVLPTHAECTAVVFCESSSYGLPSLCYDTGGCSSIITNNKNGQVFKMGQEINMKPWVDFICKITADKSAYEKLCKTSYDVYKNGLNWDIIGEKMADGMELLKR